MSAVWSTPLKAWGKPSNRLKTRKTSSAAERLVFPGVGAFGSMMEILHARGYVAPLKAYLQSGRPFLGICLGMHALFEESEEALGMPGLGLMKGRVKRFRIDRAVPHIGWNGIKARQASPLFNGLTGDEKFYFVHAYHVAPENPDVVLTATDYGYEFVSAVQQGNIMGTQFHPEKSGVYGRRILGNFLAAATSAVLPVHVPETTQLARRIIACLDVRANDRGDLVVTKGDQYDVREAGQVRNLGLPVDLARRYYREGADEITFLNITGFRDFPLEDMPMLEVLKQTSRNVFVPLTIGGGIRNYTDKNGRTYSALEVAAEYFRSGAGAKATGDTIDLMGPYGQYPYRGDFETADARPGGEGLLPDGWTSIDETAPINNWHVDTYGVTAPLSGKVAWCGDIAYASCGSGDPAGGYGNNVYGILEFRKVVAGPATVRVQADLQYDCEPGYDYVYLRRRTAANPDFEPVAAQGLAWDGVGTVAVDYTFTYTQAELFQGNQIAVAFVFDADAGWSDSDCLWPTNGAARVDNITVTLNDTAYTEDFEDGALGPDWVATPNQGVGDFARVWQRLGDLDDCASNYSKLVAFIDDGLVVPGTGGSPGQPGLDYGPPGGWVVNPHGGLLSPWTKMSNYVLSPVMALPEPGAGGLTLAFDVYQHALTGIDWRWLFYSWQIRSTAGGEITQAPWVDRNFLYYGGPNYARSINVVDDLLVPGATHIQVALGVVEPLTWCDWCDQNLSSPGAVLRQRQRQDVRDERPAHRRHGVRLANDTFPASGALDLENLSSNSVPVRHGLNVAARGPTCETTRGLDLDRRDAALRRHDQPTGPELDLRPEESAVHGCSPHGADHRAIERIGDGTRDAYGHRRDRGQSLELRPGRYGDAVPGGRAALLLLLPRQRGRRRPHFACAGRPQRLRRPEAVDVPRRLRGPLPAFGARRAGGSRGAVLERPVFAAARTSGTAPCAFSGCRSAWTTTPTRRTSRPRGRQRPGWPRHARPDRGLHGHAVHGRRSGLVHAVERRLRRRCGQRHRPVEQLVRPGRPRPVHDRR